MKTRIATATAVVAFAATFLAPSAQAVPIDQLRNAVVSTTGSSGQVNVTVDGKTATLSGYVDDVMTARAVRRKVLSYDDIDGVVDLMDRD